MRKTAIILVIALWGANGVAHAQTQEEPQQQPSRPVFSLPPGNQPAEQPNPNVQGPRAPGVPAPRAIDPNAPREQRPSASQTPAQPSAAPPRQTAPTRNPPPTPRANVPQSGSAREATRTSPSTTTTQTSRATPSGTVAPPDVTADVTGDVTDGDTLFDIGPESADSTPSAAAPTIAPSAAADSGSPPIWLIALVLLLVGGVGFFFWQRRAQPVADSGVAATAALAPRPTPEPQPEPRTEPAPAPVPQSAEVLASAPPTEPTAAQLQLDFEPIEARWSEAGLAIKFRLYLRNISDQPVHDIAVHLGIRSADANLGPSAGPAGLPNLYLETLAAKDMSAHEGEMRLDEQTIAPVMVDGQEMVLPVIDIMPRYRDSANAMRKIQAALLVGRERNPPSEKLAPLPIQRTLSPGDRLGCRMIALPR